MKRYVVQLGAHGVNLWTATVDAENMDKARYAARKLIPHTQFCDHIGNAKLIKKADYAKYPLTTGFTFDEDSGNLVHTTNNIKEEKKMTGKEQRDILEARAQASALSAMEVNLEEAEATNPEPVAEPTPAPATKPLNRIAINPRGFICPTDKMIQCIINYQTDVIFTEQIPWPKKGYMFIESAGELIKWFKAQAEAGAWTPHIYKTRAIRYQAWLATARRLAEFYPEAQVSSRYTTENAPDTREHIDD